MKSIKSFNEDLNRSDKSRYVHWEGYRRALTQTIVSYLNQINHKQASEIFMMSVGNADDLDLAAIEKLSKRMVLTDIDAEGLKHAFKRYTLNKQKTSIEVMDYTGLEQTGKWQVFLRDLLVVEDFEAMSCAIDRLFTDLTINFHLQHLHQYDIVIVLPIYTQLLYQQFHQHLAISGMNYMSVDAIKQSQAYFLERLSSMIDAFNRAVFRLLKDQGSAIIISDILETHPGSLFDQQMHQALAKQMMDLFHADYVKRYGLGIGDFGLENAKTYGRLAYSTWFEWPFSEARHLMVRMDIIELKKSSRET